VSACQRGEVSSRPLLALGNGIVIANDFALGPGTSLSAGAPQPLGTTVIKAQHS
jgi:hypothetical protein